MKQIAIQSALRELDSEAKVMELIDRDRLGWDREKLDWLFRPEEVQAILKIPIRPHMEDAKTGGILPTVSSLSRALTTGL